MKKKVLLLLLVGFLALPTEAQNVSTQGKDFWVSFMGNGFKTRYDTWSGLPDFTWLRIQLIVSAKRNCNCTIQNPNTGYQETFHVNANSTYLFDDIPWEEAYMELEEYGQILGKGLHITADDTISVYCTNIAEVSFDASYVLPTPALGDDYIIQTYDQTTNSNVYGNYYTSAFVIVATEEGETSVDITPSVNTLDGHLAGETYSITMHKGEAYQVRSHNNYSGSRDLSGTRVTAADCKKLAVFNGNNLTMVPDSGQDSDCVFEQAMPLAAWGKKFVVTASLGRTDNDYVKVTSAHDNNEIYTNDNYLTTLNAGESFTFELRQMDRSCFIEASQSCAVYLYNHSADDYGIGDGAPSMVWIAPIEQRINEITFSTFNYVSEHETDITDHYINIIVDVNDVQHVYLDGNPLSPLLFEPVNGTSEYRYLRTRIEHGSHHLTCANGFNAHVYGFAHARGYAYMVGSNAKNLSSNLTINNEAVLPNGVYPFCAEQEVTFNAEVNFAQYDILWDFGDGTTSTENPAHHTYHDRRLFSASLYISTDGGGCTGSASNTTYFFVDATQQYITYNDEVCEGELYSGHGFNNVRIDSDTLLVRLEDNPIHSECQDSVLLYITAHPTYHRPINDSRCWHGEPGVYNAYGFSFVYDEPGIYDRQLNLQTHTYGCDSIITLHLVVDNQITYEFDTTTCSAFVWDGHSYTQSGDYENQYSTPNGCDSIVTCHLHIGGTYYAPSAVSGIGCNSYTWNEKIYTESGYYTDTVPSLYGCDSIIYLDLALTHTPNPTKIRCEEPGAVVYGDPEGEADTAAVVTNTEFFSFQYTFKVKESEHNTTECPWDRCDWTISKPSWIIDYDDAPKVSGDNKYYSQCTVYVAEHDDDLVELTATIHNDCDSVVRKFYLKSSFFDIDEQSLNPSDFSIVPNPNNGEMTLHFKNMTGPVEVSVYDMLGTLVDRLVIENNAEVYSLPYQLNAKSSGIYCFVATGRNGKMAKKVILAH